MTANVPDFQPWVDEELRHFTDALASDREFASGDEQPDLEKVRLCLVGLKELARRRRAAGDSRPSERRLPASVGRFRILGELGVGGFGIVYRALDPGTLREVAIKIPRFEVLATPSLLERFELESRAAARLEHPNIVAVHEAGVDGFMPYIVSAYYPGITLAEFIHRVPHIPPREAALCVQQLAAAVMHAHERGVLHRDIKPSNVLLVPHEEGETELRLSRFTPKLMDFGLAKLSESGIDLTKTGALIGSIRYMAPEQAQGKSKEITQATDIYSLGVILYELLTGKPPFGGDNDVQILDQLVHQDPVSPSRLGRAVPRDLEIICTKCLEKEPGRRYATAKELAEDLGRYLDGMPILARPSTPFEQLVKWVRRRPLIAALSAISLFAVVALILAQWRFSHRLQDSLEIAEAGRLREQRYRYASEMHLAFQAWEQHKIGEVQRLLEEQIPRDGDADLRNFAWYYLHRLVHGDLATLRGHQGSVYAVAFAPDDQLLVSGGEDGNVIFWDTQDWQEVCRFHEHTNDINALAFSPDGRLLASASADRTIRIWDPKGRKLLHTLAGHEDEVCSLCFAPDGQSLHSGSYDRTVRIWSTQSWQQTDILRDFESDVDSIAFNTDGSLFAVSCSDITVRVYDAKSLKIVHRIRNHEAHAAALWLDRADCLATIGWRGPIYLWHAADDSNVDEPREIATPAIPFLATASPDGSKIIVADDAGGVLFFDVESGQQVGKLPAHAAKVRSASFNSIGSLLATASSDGTVKIWDPKPREELAEARVEDATAVAVTDQYLFLSKMDATVDRVGVTDGSTVTLCQLPFVARSLKVSPDGAMLAAGRQDGRISILDAHSGRERRCLKLSGNGAVTSVDFSEDGAVLAAGSEGGDAATWQMRDGKMLARFPTQSGKVHVVLAEKGRTLITGAATGLQLWDAYRGHQRDELLTEPVTALSATPDGSLLAAAIANRHLIMVWDLRVPDFHRLLTGHTETVNSLSLSGDRASLVSASRDGSTRLWDVYSGQQLHQWPCSDQGSDGNYCGFAENRNVLLLGNTYDQTPSKVWLATTSAAKELASGPTEESQRLVATYLSPSEAIEAVFVDEKKESIGSQATLDGPVAKITFRFTERPSLIGGVTGTHSVLNRSNWLLRQGPMDLSQQIRNIEVRHDRLTDRWLATLYFDPPLIGGNYQLSALPSIRASSSARSVERISSRAGAYSCKLSVAGGAPSFLVHKLPAPSSEPDVGFLSDGSIVLAWSGKDSIHGQIFDPSGRPTTAPFSLFDGPDSACLAPCIAVDSGNRILFTWQDLLIDDSRYGVNARFCDRQGKPLTECMRINGYLKGTQSDPRIAVLPVGRFQFTWISNEQDGSKYGIFMKPWSSNDSVQAEEYQVNATTFDSQIYPDIAADADGDFVIVWQSSRDKGCDILGQCFNSQGQRVGDEFAVSEPEHADQVEPRIAMQADGTSVIAWTNQHSEMVYARVMNPKKDQRGEVFLVAGNMHHRSSNPEVAFLSPCEFIVVWCTRPPAGKQRVYGRRFHISGQPVGPEFRLDTGDCPHEDLPAVAVGPKGQVVFAWTVDYRDTRGTEVHFRMERFDGSP